LRELAYAKVNPVPLRGSDGTWLAAAAIEKAEFSPIGDMRSDIPCQATDFTEKWILFS
jgi:hypothetical protein